ncbi:DUF7536 family protein [Halapricum hydrolyticum]|uniref:Uncharacterized protein n=1 Tax=Halapricum hydrolyticum TaxID=2979991 RepID=A0AAE3LF58_9EURY|nr:hypothetical protein [Halapricum hydrolyticum]MCU4717796.1 hypothetical protein [Halapricum hydrolyticum]MCU4726960.1 hypothetical protein [Halapricum hydrolyticum]
MSGDRPESGRARFLEALEVRKHAVRGFAIAIALTILVYVLFVVLPGGGESAIWYLGLGASLALSLGGLLTMVFVAFQARRLTKEL